MPPDITVSVIIPTFNRASLLPATIDSVLAQTCTDSEIIVVDDGSDDNTAEIVYRYTVAHGERIRYYWQTNQGKSVALNTALSKVRGKFIAFLDSDDCWHPDKLEWQLFVAAQLGTAYPCFTDANYTNNPHLQMTAFEFAHKHYKDEFGLIKDPTQLFLATRSGLYMQTFVIRRDVAERVGEFDPTLLVGNDTDYLFRLSLLSPFCFVNKPLVSIDRTTNRQDGLIELITTNDPLRLKEHKYLYTKWLALTRGCSKSLRDQLLGRLAETYNDWANWHLVNGEYDEARKALFTAVVTRFTAKATAKLLVATLAPAFARYEFRRRDKERSRRRVIA